MKVKDESEKVGLKLNIQKTKIMASGPITSWQIDGETIEKVTDFYFWGLQNHCRWWLQPWNKKTLAWKKSYDKPRLYSLQLKMQVKLYTVSKIRPEADCGLDHELSLLLLLSRFSQV